MLTRKFVKINVAHKMPVYIKIITNRLTTKQDDCQSVEEVAFRRGFDTSDYLLSFKILMDKSKEYNSPVFTCFNLVMFE